MGAPKGNNNNPNGRGPKPIDWEQFEEMCHLQCTQEEMASLLKVDVETLRDRAREYYKEFDFSLIYKRFSSGGKMSLRRYQYKMSQKNATMAIWLGKNWLDQKDNTEEVKVSSDTVKQFGEVMSQLSSLQSSKSSQETSFS